METMPEEYNDIDEALGITREEFYSRKPRERINRSSATAPAPAPEPVVTPAREPETRFVSQEPAKRTPKKWGKNPYAIVQHYVESASKEYGVPVDLINAVIHQESRFNPNATSGAGAQGYMQLTPATAEYLGVRDPYSPVQNIRAGTRYLRELLKRFDGDETLALAAYNAGPTRVERLGRVPAIPETQEYVKEVKKHRRNPSKLREMYRIAK